MAGSIPEALVASPPPSLALAVRLALADPRFEPEDVSVRQLSDQGIRNPESLLLVEGGGTGDRGTLSWSLVLKVIANEDADDLPADDLWYWKREVLAFQSGILDGLTGIRAPICYVTDEREDATWVWMEYVNDRVPGRWADEDFARAARAAGRFAGAWVGGAQVPDAPWLVRDHARGWAEALSPEHAWGSPFVARAFSASTRSRVMRSWYDRERLYGWLSRLPTTFGHGDFHRRNLVVEGRGEDPAGIVAVDWAWCGRLPLGGDLGMLLAMSTILGELEPGDLERIEAPVTEAYLAGLAEAGAPDRQEEARLGSGLWLAIYAGLTTPALTAFWTSDDQVADAQRAFGQGPEALARQWADACQLALDRSESITARAGRLFSSEP